MLVNNVIVPKMPKASRAEQARCQDALQHACRGGYSGRAEQITGILHHPAHQLILEKSLEFSAVFAARS